MDSGKSSVPRSARFFCRDAAQVLFDAVTSPELMELEAFWCPT
jgi:hypothetical protein